MKSIILAIAIILLFANISEAITIEYEILTTVVECYKGTDKYTIKFTYQLMFSELTVANRVKMGLPLGYYEASDEDQEQIVYTDGDTLEIVSFSGNIPYYVEEAVVKTVILIEVEERKQSYLEKLNSLSDNNRILSEGGFFVARLRVIGQVGYGIGWV